jgi:hypothetical protein
MSGFRVALDSRGTAHGGLLPQNFPVLPVDAVKLERVRTFSVDRFDVAKQSELQSTLTLCRYCRSEENPIPPNDGTGVCQTWNLHLPQDVLTRFTTPMHRRTARTDAGSARPAELRPVRLSISRQNKQENGTHAHPTSLRLKCRDRLPKASPGSRCSQPLVNPARPQGHFRPVHRCE